METENYYIQILFSALIGAIIGQFILVSVNYLKEKIQLNKKRKLIQVDLMFLKAQLTDLNAKFEELYVNFKIKNLKRYQGNIAGELNRDVFDSLSKIELYKIYGDKFPILIKIYSNLIFVKQNNPYQIYKNYTEELQEHQDEMANEENHPFYCDSHMQIIEIAMENIRNIQTTISFTIKDINSITRL